MKKLNKIILILFSTAALFCLLCAFFVFAVNLYVLSYSKPYIYTDINKIPEKYVVIIPGARVYKNNVSHVVRDRIDSASGCLRAGKVSRVLVSGDHGRKDYDEVNQIRLYMQRVYNTDENIIFTDHAGFSTYETMYRARDVFCVKDAIIVTQKFHTARSVFLARKLGLDAVALVSPELVPYSRMLHAKWEIRESLARVKAFFSVIFLPKPKFLGEQIPITGDAEKTRG